jgi:hypothetical protein
VAERLRVGKVADPDSDTEMEPQAIPGWSERSRSPRQLGDHHTGEMGGSDVGFAQLTIRLYSSPLLEGRSATGIQTIETELPQPSWFPNAPLTSRTRVEPMIRAGSDGNVLKRPGKGADTEGILSGR